jgi:NADPH-dependent glutamate synthase beta subunit-like oxidoreductase/NAD(P)H-flavin reductase
MDYQIRFSEDYGIAELLSQESLEQLDKKFLEFLERHNYKIFSSFSSYRSFSSPISPIAESELLMSASMALGDFLGSFFGIEAERKAERSWTNHVEALTRCRKEFVIRRVAKKIPAAVITKDECTDLRRQARQLLSAIPRIPHDDPELETASGILTLLEHERFVKVGLTPQSINDLQLIAQSLQALPNPPAFVPLIADENALRVFLGSSIALMEQWLGAVLRDDESEEHGWTMLQLPRPMDFMHLVEFEQANDGLPSSVVGHECDYRRRDGFDLTDERYDRRRVMGEVEYCIFCHERGKDSCSKGMTDGASVKKNPLGYPLNGCPLDQKISESHSLKAGGDSIAALAMIMIDNPMVPGTGHRICNDCMKACIYQKQDPVNIPQIETRILSDVLSLPWGFEIYSLLSRWNPLNRNRPVALPYNGMNVLVVGMGPAGYSLAHYLLNEGFGVVGIDGLKIEPLPSQLFETDGRPKPVRSIATLMQRLSERPLTGFGGVSEYGITVRWDKNFLTLLYMNLLRRSTFRMFDGVRFGGTMTVEDAWNYGFDHVCIATGAGKPTFVSMKNNLIRGIRKASDFLMALQLTGAGKRDSMANLQVRLPAIVIGGGLTAIDTATELMAYYPIQVEKIRTRYDRLVGKFGKESVDAMFDPTEKEALAEFLGHASAIEAERKRAADAGERPNFIPLIRAWGGVKILYRKSMLDAPAYRLNHEEIIKGLEEGIAFVERMNPVEAVPDDRGAVKEMVFEEMELRDGRWKSSGRQFRVPARTVIVAAGTVPNVMYERERPGTFELDEDDEFFQTHELDPGLSPKKAEGEEAFFTSYRGPNGETVSFYGDNHPAYAGNVVKAMASAKNGYKSVVDALAKRRRTCIAIPKTWAQIVSRLSDELKATVVKVERLTPTITEVVVRAPKAAREFRPGQFYRLQNYEADSPRIDGTLVMMEGIALTGAWVDPEKGLIGMIALEVGASSRMCAMLKPGQRVVVMGPTGTPTHIPRGETVLLLGGGLGNAVLFSIGKAIRAQGGKVIYFAGYKKAEDFFRREWIEEAADVVVYGVDAGQPIAAERQGDMSFVGNIVQAMLAYAGGQLGPVTLPLSDATHLVAIGSDRMMDAVAKARHTVLKPHLRLDHVGVASINSPMQCMMKAICAQCLQRHVDPATGKESFVFTCINQDQKMDEVDFANLNSRLKQNSVMEKITNRWLDVIQEAIERQDRTT